jgi:glycosyltransferase XagB
VLVLSALGKLWEPVCDGPPYGRRERTRRSTQALHHAIFALALSQPAFSARRVATRRQLAALLVCGLTLVIALALWPASAASAIVALMSVGFLISAALRMTLAWLDAPILCAKAAIPDEALPTYTILLPLHHEAGMLPQLAGAMAALDYPKDKLDLIFIVEEDDGDTRAAAEALGLEQMIVVPNAEPRTKPKACNYALPFANGKYLVVYDAEDRPEPDQLRKAVEAFRAAPDVDCFQARLSIANGQGWLRGLFALDYGIWFETLLPGLACLRAPIPLGGTSNHFRTASLVAAGAWDPFNVTEDADLGLRLARKGYRVSMLDSSTFEDAPRHFCTWLRQRTRWMKGYMQTMLVHTRDPVELARGVGLRGCLVIHAFLGGAVWSALVNPLLWVLCIAGCLGSEANTGALHIFAWISGSALLAANGVLALLSLMASRGRAAVLASALSYPIYWLLISIAAYRALWQLMRDPFHWEKTPHGEAECANA